jgi:UMF1 family MFS transporter
MLYDFANSAFTTLVITFVYATYFTEAIAPDRITGTVLWSRAITITAIVVALASPLLGALADRGGLRKTFILGSTAICVAATAALYKVMPGQVFAALTLVIVANIAFECGTVFYNAFLPDVSSPKTIGTVSGWGWGLGYLGGLVALVIALLGFIQADPPWFGFSTEQGENIRATNLLVSLWFVVFSLPLLLFIKESRTKLAGPHRVVADAVQQLVRTFREVRKHKETAKFLVARLVYNDGLVTIFAFGGIYAAGTFGFTLSEVLVFGIVINLAAGVGAIAMGYLDDIIGAKKTIMLSLIGLAFATVVAVLATDRTWLWVAGILLGIFVGPNQSASRSLMGRLAPQGMQNEFFGFFAMSGKLTAFIGPLLLGFATQAANSQRAGIAVVLFMFIGGFILLANVRAGGPVQSGQVA